MRTLRKCVSFDGVIGYRSAIPLKTTTALNKTNAGKLLLNFLETAQTFAGASQPQRMW
jgi:hypothetical protein